MSSGTIAVPAEMRRESDLPGLAIALNPKIARNEFRRRLPKLSGDGTLQLKAVRVIRLKPGRRCVLEYDVEVRRPDLPRHRVTLIGKTRARRSGNEGFRIQQAIWDAGFRDDSPDGISVPEPIGVISDFCMWFQRKVPGVTTDKLLGAQDAVVLGGRIAEAMNKLHRAGVPTDKVHSIDDELKILRDCLLQVAQVHPAWSRRLEEVIAACERVAATVPVPKPCGIHRDFYSSQVIVDGSRLWLLDFDLYCQGDPALDAGNFIGHITEQALRERGRADAFIEVERVMEDRFVELSGEATRLAVRAYTNLTLVRHIFLSTNFPDRQHLSESLLQLCEKRLN
jgi:hypothetical protein